MLSFTFDETLSIDQNLAAFFKHLRASNEEFGSYLERMLPSAVAATFSREVFNRGVETMLDAGPGAESKGA